MSKRYWRWGVLRIPGRYFEEVLMHRILPRRYVNLIWKKRCSLHSCHILLCHGCTGVFFYSDRSFRWWQPDSMDLWSISALVWESSLSKPLMLGQFVLSLHLVSLASLPVVLQFLLAFVALDFTRYWLHYMHHRVPFFWQFHRVHHSSATLYDTSGLRMHLFDFSQLALLPTLRFSPIVDIRTWSEWMLPPSYSLAHSSMLFNMPTSASM